MVYDCYVVECKNDVAFVKELTKGKYKQIYHAGNKTNVLKKLGKWSNCVGLIDEDPRSHQPPKLRDIQLQDVGNDIKVGKYNDNLIVVLCPRLEDWLEKVARKARIQKDINAKDLEDEKRLVNVIQKLTASNPEPEPIRQLRDLLLRGL
jgi:hypothetical protein